MIIVVWLLIPVGIGGGVLGNASMTLTTTQINDAIIAAHVLEAVVNVVAVEQ